MVGLNKKILFSLVENSLEEDGSNLIVMAFIKVQLTFQGLAVFFETIMIFV
jgi:hypothetical protein